MNNTANATNNTAGDMCPDCRLHTITDGPTLTTFDNGTRRVQVICTNCGHGHVETQGPAR